MLEDNGSKFGTLLRVDNPIRLVSLDANNHPNITIQVERSLIFLELENKKQMTIK